MGWTIRPQILTKRHRGNHKIFTDKLKADTFLDQHKGAYIVQTAYSEKEGFSEWKVYFPDYEGMTV